MDRITEPESAEIHYKMFESLARVRDGQKVTITTEGGSFSGRVSEVVGPGDGLLLDIDPHTKMEITLRSPHQARGSFVYTVIRKKADGTWNIDEQIADDPSKMMLGGLRISKKIKKVVIE